MIKSLGQNLMLPKEEIVNLFSDEGSQSQKFPVNSMKNSLQKVSFPAKYHRIRE